MSLADAARQVVADAIRARVFPAAAVEVGTSAEVLWREAFGTMTFESAAPATDATPFDLASLTKPLATTTLALQLVTAGRLGLDDLVSKYFHEWAGAGRGETTVRDLLEHASGLAARLVDPPPATRREFEHEICRMPLEYQRRTASLYSDLGFILLGFLVEDVARMPLAEVRLKPDTTAAQDVTFVLDIARRRLAAPTLPMDGDPRRGRLLTGEVHDNYAAALGGAAGHAGLFGTAAGVGEFARAILRAGAPFSAASVRLMTTKSSVPGSSRALGWDTMLPTSSCGTRMSASAFGHVGYTGTSLWIDPDRDRYYVLLTNRACGGGTLDQMRDVRRAFHDALASG